MSAKIRRAGRVLPPLALVPAIALAGACGAGAPEQGVVARTLRELESELWRARSARASEPRLADPVELGLVVAELLQTLAEVEEPRRRAIDEEFRRLGRDAAPGLSQRLLESSASREERAAAARALAATQSAEGAAALLQCVEERALASRTPPPGESAVGDAWLREQCAWRLAAMSQDWILPRLLLCLRDEPEPNVVIAIAEALRAHDNLAALERLRRIADEGEPAELRSQAAATLAQWALDLECDDESDLLRIWSEADPQNRLVADPPSLELRVDAWEHIARLAQWDPDGAGDSHYVLVHLSPWIQAPLARALEDPSRPIRTALARVLRDRGSRARACAPALRGAIAAAEDEELARALGAALDATLGSSGPGADSRAERAEGVSPSARRP